jgi:HTH-type transcriptional regulator, competence development regulator
MEIDPSFGRKIQELRQNINLSQRELAKKANLDYTYLSKIENAKMPPPQPDVITKLAEVLGADINELLVLAGKSPPGLSQTIKRSEAARKFLFRHAPKLSEEEWECLLREAEKKSKKDK